MDVCLAVSVHSLGLVLVLLVRALLPPEIYDMSLEVYIYQYGTSCARSAYVGKYQSCMLWT